MKKLISVFGILAVLVFAPPAFADPLQVSSPGSSPLHVSSPSGTTNVSKQLTNPLKDEYNTFSKFTAAVVKTAVNVMLPFVVLGFIYSGFIFVKAQGNEKELEAAKTAIWYSVIGAFILFGAWGFAQIISTTVSTLTETTPAP